MSELLQFGPEIWIADGPVVSFYGFPYPTRMSVIRLSDGSLFVCSPVALSDSLRAAIDALGAVRHLVSPNALPLNSIATAGPPKSAAAALRQAVFGPKFAREPTLSVGRRHRRIPAKTRCLTEL